MSLGGGMARAKAQGQEQRSGVRRVGLGRCTDPFKGSHGHVECALSPFEKLFIFDCTGSLLLHTGFLSLHMGA